LSGLLDAWSASDRARRHEWTLVAHAPIPGAQRWPAAVHIIPGSGGTYWEQFTLPRALGANRPDLLFAPGYTAPLTVATPLVLTIHDVSFFAHPEWFSIREGTRRRLLTAWSARRARAVITDTQFSKTEIARHIGVKNVFVVPLGIDGGQRRLDDPAGDRSPMVLFVGSLFQRRRVHRLIEAFDLVAERVPGAHLEIVGENRTRPYVDFELLRRRCAYAERITIRSYVDEATLALLYSRASVFAFLSEYEGFGLTPLEALAGGVPPVVLDTPVARETCGDAARYLSPAASNEDIASTIAELLTDAGARANLLRHRTQALRHFDWTVTAGATLAVLEEAAGAR
jgi:glycosyltransferase involved in cell wall biosynthesis